MPHTWASVQPAVYTLSATTRTVQPGSITNYLSYLRMAPAAFSACVMLVREPKEVRHTAWQLLPQNSSSQSKSFPPAATWRGKSGSGTHDVELIPAMYNSPTAGGQHVHLHSQDSRQASLNHWHLLLVMCHSAHSMGGGFWVVSASFWASLFGQMDEVCENANCGHVSGRYEFHFGPGCNRTWMWWPLWQQYMT